MVFCFSGEMLYFSATFSEVMPMGTKHATANGLVMMSLENFSGSIPEAMLYMDMDSTPPARPTSITPDLMLAEMFATAWRPLLHWRFTELDGISYGSPPRNCAIREVAAPAPGWETLPIWMSPMAMGSIFVFSMTALNNGASMSSQGVSLKPPLLAFAIAVRSEQQMTTSSSDFSAALMAAVGAASKGAAATVLPARTWREMS
mmetsp:Transcript_16328/g.34483  ORF Transcript_16328/g.34483 Transcript_16328/m.34483 type:complete len:203 (-) Transcript_16328:89-697(-)